jgi:serine protease Do
MKHGLRFGVAAIIGGMVAGMALAAGAETLHATRWSLSSMGMYGVAMGGSHGLGSKGSNGYLGVETRDVADDEVGTLKLKEATGAEIVNVDHDGPACKAGMQVRDVILQINGQVIDDEGQLRRTLRETPAGRTVNVVVSRDGQTMTMTMTMADRRTVGMEAWEQHYTVSDPGLKGGYGGQGSGFMSSGSTAITGATPKGHRDFLATSMILSSSFTGAQLELMGPQLAQYFGAEGAAGLLVRSVEGNSPAELAGMRAGDVVVRINSVPVTNEADWTKTVHENKGRPLPVVVIRDKHEQILTLTPDGKKRSSVKPGLGLEGFFEGTGQYTRELVAKL